MIQYCTAHNTIDALVTTLNLEFPHVLAGAEMEAFNFIQPATQQSVAMSSTIKITDDRRRLFVKIMRELEAGGTKGFIYINLKPGAA